jgi:hypothetical protein
MDVIAVVMAASLALFGVNPKPLRPAILAGDCPAVHIERVRLVETDTAAASCGEDSKGT